MSGEVSGPATPYLRVDVDRLEANLRRVADRTAAAGVALRPHAKTHKSLEVARRQLAAGAVGLTVAAIGEAEVFAEVCDDLLVAYPLWVTPTAADRLRALAERVTVTIGVDSVDGAAQAGRLLAGSGVSVLVEIDPGLHRTGVPPEEAGAVAAASGLPVRGAFTFPGHSYDPTGRRQAAADEARVLAAVDLDGPVRSGGSTPSLEAADVDVLTELRPGVYAFGDAQQWELGAMAASEIALTCRATVISHASGRLVLDAGSKALGADRAAYASGWGRLPAYDDARVVLLSEHHAVVDLAGADLPPLGSTVDVVPNHVCSAVNLHDTLWAAQDGSLEPWVVDARGRNS